MKISRKCPICNKQFIAIKVTQLYDKRSCFKKSYYAKIKARLRTEASNPVYPKKECGFCKTISQLNFNPIRYPHLFDSWECPVCGVNNQILWKYQEQNNSYEIIQNLLTLSNQGEKPSLPHVDTILAQNRYHPIGQEQKSAIVIVTYAETNQTIISK